MKALTILSVTANTNTPLNGNRRNCGNIMVARILLYFLLSRLFYNVCTKSFLFLHNHYSNAIFCLLHKSSKPSYFDPTFLFPLPYTIGIGTSNAFFPFLHSLSRHRNINAKRRFNEYFYNTRNYLLRFAFVYVNCFTFNTNN